MASDITASSLTSIEALLPSWRRSLRAENKSPKTIESYLSSAEQLAAFLAERGMPTDVAGIRREHVEAWIEDILTRRKATTAAVRYRSVQQLFRWLGEEGEITESPMRNMRPPKVDEIPVPVLDKAEQVALLRVRRRRLRRSARHRDHPSVSRDRRPTRRVGRPRADRRSRCAARRPRGRTLYGAQERPAGACPTLAPRPAQAMDRYLRARRVHPHSASTWVWIGRKGRLTAGGIAEMLDRRGEQAGIENLHPHVFRPHVRPLLAR